ncbi:MAG: GTP cyclohydrolase II [Rhizobiales bacterium]|nr:GTP cyclohydrolase II [Hyphomicrobiales bacterium]
MSAGSTAEASILFGTTGQISVSRGLAEFHARRPVLVTATSEILLALPVEGLDAQRLAAFVDLCAPAVPQLVITARRALALGLPATTPMTLRLSARDGADTILSLVANAKTAGNFDAMPAGLAASAAIQLVKLSHGLPAVLTAEVAAATDPQIVTVEAEAVARFGNEVIDSLAIASEALVPLNSGTRTRFVVFRDAMGGSSVAIIVGKPDVADPVPVRLHSACLTGDVFGSRRCDCGDQLKLALARLEEMGGGIILYLAQEGRGLGLANKMRTYQLQDDGLDTVDANTTLGFDDDERDYGIAARMLQILDCTRIALLTNNPAKLDGLAKAGIAIASRMPLVAPINPDNRRYLTAKAARAGHHLDHLIASLAEASEPTQDVAPLAT